MRKVAVGIAIVILVLIVAAAVFVATFNVNKYHGTIQAELEKRVGRPVSLGDMHLGLFPPRFRVNDVVISEDPAFHTQLPFLKAQDLDISVKLLPLLSKKVEISSLNLQKPDVQLIRNRQGTWNFASLGKTNQPTSEEPSAAQPQPLGQPAAQPQAQNASAQQFSLSKLMIRDGQVSVLDEQTSHTPSVYNHIDLTLSNYVSGQPFSIEAVAHLPGTGAEEARLQGRGGPVDSAQPANTPFHGSATLNQVGVSNLSQYLHSSAFSGVDGSLSGQTKIDSSGGNITAQGGTHIDNAKVRGQALGYPIDANYDISDELASNLITLRNVAVTLGSMPIQMSGTVDAKNSPAQLNLNTKADNLQFSELEKLAALAGSSLPSGMNVTGTVNANVQARGPADKPALDGTITASNIQASGNQIAQPIQIQAINLDLTPTQIQSNPFNVVSGGTTVNTQFSLQNYLSAAPIVAATAKTTNAQLPAILSMAKAYGVKALDKVSGSGVINMDMHATGPVKSLTSQEVLKTLNGTINVNLSNVKYSGADIGHEISSIARFIQPTSSTGQGSTTISKMTGDIQVKNGIAQTNNLHAQLDWGNIAITGTATLADEALDMHGLVALSQPESQKVGGTSIGGFMQTALADKQGQLVVPVLITGTFSSPKFAPDAQQLAKMKVQGLAANLNNPSSLTGALQHFVGGQTPAGSGQAQQQGQQPSNPGQPAQNQNPVQHILGLFGGK